MDGFIFSALKDSENQRSPRYCSPKLVFVFIIYVCMVMLLWWYKVRRRLYVNERFVKLTLSGKNILKNGPDKIWRLSMLGVRPSPPFFRLESNARPNIGLVGRSDWTPPPPPKKKKTYKKTYKEITRSIGMGDPGTPGIRWKLTLTYLD